MTIDSYEERERIRRFIAQRVRDVEDAEDLVQDVMLRTLAASMPPRDEKRPAWLLQIARNAIIDHYRTRSQPHDGTEAVEAVAVSEATKDDAQTSAALARCVPGILRHLPVIYRDAVRSADLEGAAQHQIAVQAGVSLSAAKSRVQRGRAMIETLIHDCCRIELDARGNVIDVEPTSRTVHYCVREP